MAILLTQEETQYLQALVAVGKLQNQIDTKMSWLDGYRSTLQSQGSTKTVITQQAKPYEDEIAQLEAEKVVVELALKSL